MIRELTCSIAGAVATLILVLSCSDDAPADADAATCDCPSVMTVEDVRPGAGGGQGLVFATARCPAGTIVLGGGCQSDMGELRLVSAGGRSTDSTIYDCLWDNPLEITATITAWATCQSP